MLKTYQFKTHCKGNIQSSKTANILSEHPYVYKRSGIQTRWHELFQPASMISWMDSIAFELEYDFVHVRAFTYYSIMSHGKNDIFNIYLQYFRHLALIHHKC